MQADLLGESQAFKTGNTLKKNWRSPLCPSDDLSPSSEQNGRDSKDVQLLNKQSRYRECAKYPNRSRASS